MFRDHPSHRFSMLGGMWGARLEEANIRRLWSGHWERMLEDELAFAARRRWGPDQDLLNKHVWPWARYLAFEHDSYQ